MEYRQAAISFLKQTKCTCPEEEQGKTVYQLQKYLDPSADRLIADRRRKEFEHNRRRQPVNKVVIAPAFSPLSFPIHGVQVSPLQRILLPGLQVHIELEQYMVSFEASLGSFDSLVNETCTKGSQINGRGQKSLTISTTSLMALNCILGNITYTSFFYSINIIDIVKVTLGEFVVQIPVSIQQPAIVRLFDPGQEMKISNLVTITTKTFLRYDKLHILIKSIRQYYPDIKIIVADDSEFPEKIKEANVEQYIMPYGKGWFAGRNLAVSQVTTKYFLWVDDDFLFTKDTRIETMVDVLEKTDLDLVGGSVAGNHFSFKLSLEEGDEDGDCLHWREGSYHEIPGFPNCVLTDGVVNFFLAMKDSVMSVGFDPKLQRVAHTEFFIDALGRLRVGSCPHVIIGHQKKTNFNNQAMAEESKKYDSFRENTKEQVQIKLELLYFKNRLRCFAKH
ncbi:beta-1,4 N-acetylgalactosaminyltransferase 2 [Pelodytes ibericus]